MYLVVPVFKKRHRHQLVSFTFTFYNCIVQMGFLPWETPWGKPAATVMLPSLGCMLGVLVFPYFTKLWHVLRDLKSAHRFKCIRMCTGVYGHRKRVCTESWLWKKNPLQHREIKPVSVACWSNALLTELHPHPSHYPVLLTSITCKAAAHITHSSMTKHSTSTTS